MIASPETIDWLLDSDPSLKWQVQRDLLELPAEIWHATKNRTATEGFGARLLALQDEDGQWAGGAHFPTRVEPRAITREGEESRQPFIATSWSLNALREWGVPASALGNTAERLRRNCRWEYENLPFWDGEVDCCINAFTVSNGLWLGVEVSKNAEWFLDHQLEDGGWNCEWEEGSTRSSFHSTLNSLIGLLDYEKATGRDQKITEARQRAEEYLLQRKLMYRLSTNEIVGPWVTQFTYPARWAYSIIRALNYFKDAREFDGKVADKRMSEATDLLISMANERGRWGTNDRLKGTVWFDVDVEVGEESKWVTFFALRARK